MDMIVSQDGNVAIPVGGYWFEVKPGENLEYAVVAYGIDRDSDHVLGVYKRWSDAQFVLSMIADHFGGAGHSGNFYMPKKGKDFDYAREERDSERGGKFS